MSDLSYLDQRDLELVKVYLISQITEQITSEDFLPRFKGLIAVVDTSEVRTVVDGILRRLVTSKTKQERETAMKFLQNEYWSTEAPNDKAILDRVDKWIEHFEERDDDQGLTRLRELRETLDLPF